MKSVLKQLVAVATFAAAVVAQADLTVNTPINVVVCRPVLFTWEGGQPPYFLTIRPGGQPAGATPLHDFGEVGDVTSLRWVPNLPPNTPAGLDLRDSSGRVAQSADFTILSGTDTSCVGQEPSGSSTEEGPSSSASAPASSGSGSSTVVVPPVTSSASSTPSSTSLTRSVTTSTVSRSSTVSSPAASSDTPDEDGAASANYVPVAMAGLVGAAAVLLA